MKMRKLKNPIVPELVCKGKVCRNSFCFLADANQRFLHVVFPKWIRLARLRLILESPLLLPSCKLISMTSIRLKPQNSVAGFPCCKWTLWQAHLSETLPSMYIYIYIYTHINMYIYIYVYIYICIHIYIYMYIYIYMNQNVYIYTHTYVYLYSQIYIYIYIHIYIYISLNMCIYIVISIYIYIYILHRIKSEYIIWCIS